MKFTLTYDGELRSNKPKAKWGIRQQLSPQLAELWRVDPVLLNLTRNRLIPATDGFMTIDVHHTRDGTRPAPQAPSNPIDLCEPVSKGGWTFIPLVRERLALHCALKITFLRKEGPGKVYQGGDMDNRLKTLFDALSVPNAHQLISGAPSPDPIYCLLEDDSLIAGINIETGRLLSRPGASEAEVRLIIEVDVRVTQARAYNHIFLGD
jgi:hypothetical protein